MKRFAIFALGIGVLVCSAAVVGAVQKQDFTLINKTGLTINKVFVGPSSEESWGSDILGKDVLEDGDKVDIKFSHSATACHWDLKVVDSRSESHTWLDINLCVACDTVTLTYDADTKKTKAKCDAPAPR